MIHSTAIVSSRAVIHPDAEIGPYAVIGDGVRIARGNWVGPHAVIEGDTEIGDGNRIAAGCVIGADSQIKAAHAAGATRIGTGNIFREYATVHASGTQGAATLIGDGNYIMSGVHIAHDCVVGSRVVIANGTQLSGHVHVGDNAFISGLTGVHQFVRIGEYAMVGGLTKLVTDVIPFALCDGNPAQVRGANLVGLKRAGFTAERVRQIKKAIRALYFSELLRDAALRELERLAADSPDVRRILDFAAASKRGIAPRAMTGDAE